VGGDCLPDRHGIVALERTVMRAATALLSVCLSVS
jgi:hypothetical protein